MDFMRQDLDAAAYVRTLAKVYGIVSAWEERTLADSPAWLRECALARKRQHMLDSDLAVFGTAPTAERAILPPLNNLYSVLGAMYVIEGSTLGGQVIARHIETRLELRTGIGNAFFSGYGEQTGRMWRDFCKVLESHVPEDRSDAVISGAKAMFTCFREWMLRTPEPLDN